LPHEQPTARLQQLEQILAHGESAVSSSKEADAAAVHLDSVPLDRIRHLTDELVGDLREEPDTIDAVAMRLLLNEYVAAVGHLRAVTRTAAARVDGAAAPMKAARRILHRLTKERDAAAASPPLREPA
jgi:hypothetical protein